jgi:hypothetical protein
MDIGIRCPASRRVRRGDDHHKAIDAAAPAFSRLGAVRCPSQASVDGPDSVCAVDRIIGGGLWILQGRAGNTKTTAYIQSAELLDHERRKYPGWIHLVGASSVLRLALECFSGAAWARG